MTDHLRGGKRKHLVKYVFHSPSWHFDLGGRVEVLRLSCKSGSLEAALAKNISLVALPFV